MSLLVDTCALIYCQTHLNALQFNSTIGSSYVSLDTPYEVDVISVRKQFF